MVISCFDTEWKKYYRCDLEGNVYRLAGTYRCKVERIIKKNYTFDGYARVELNINGKAHQLRLNRLMAMQYLHNFDNKSTVEHKNHIRDDNRLVNLCWFNLHEQQSFRVSNTKTKYIHRMKDGMWNIQFKRNKLKYQKYITKSKTLNDAILLRDKMLSMF